ncbi:MOB kinase activator-like 3 [Nephila pilipes]|uniref:MOB kinase activator-like 3 n=1 Tax=Nephila pilipes TaxID=299642 RepID=A0A8X6IZZ7_NEPPI|nr:MOB kinase activator-like 3 [Nephila pilipes]
MAGFVDFFGKNKTFRPKKKFQQGTLRYSLHKRAQASLDSAVNLQDAVKLPPGENLNDWLAVHVVDFFNRINLIYGTVIDSCTEESCPTMSGGPRFEYLWADGVQYKRPTPLPAHKYISLLMDWVESNINNEEVFPVTVELWSTLVQYQIAKAIIKVQKWQRGFRCSHSRKMTRLENWIKAIYKKDFIPSNFFKVCELHFAQEAIRYTEVYNEKTGNKINVPLKHCRLQKFAVLSIFPNCPKYISKSSNSAQECPEQRQ